MNEKIKYFRGFRIFDSIVKSKLLKIVYFFTEKSYKRNQVVYAQGENKIDGVYFIKSGEFEVSMKAQPMNKAKQ